jgi:hypothetical protein
MGDIGEYWNEHRDKEQRRKAERLKWNTDILRWAEFEYGFEVKMHSEFHYSLIHPTRGRMDLWPSTGKIMWYRKGKTTFAKTIDDIEAYLIENFKPKNNEQ